MVIQRIAGLLEGDVVRQQDRQILRRHGHGTASLAMDDRDRAAPVTLAADQPVAQAENGGAFAGTLFLQRGTGLFLGALAVEAVEEAGIIDRAVIGIGGIADGKGLRVLAGRQHDRRYGEAVFPREIQIALVMGRAAEDGAGAVFDENEIGDVNRQGLARHQRVLDLEAEAIALFLLRLDGGFRGAGGAAFGDESGDLGIALGGGFGNGVVRRDGNEARPEQRIRPGREDLDAVTLADDLEPDISAGRLADPVLLHQANLLGPAVERAQRREEVVGIIGDLQEPLAELALLHGCARAPALAVDHLLVGEHGLVDRVPVDEGFLAVGEAGLHEIEEDPLLMCVIAGMTGRQFL